MYNYVDNMMLFKVLASSLSVLASPLEVVLVTKELIKLLLDDGTRKHYVEEEEFRLLSDIFLSLNNAGIKPSLGLAMAMTDTVMVLFLARYSIVFYNHPRRKIQAIKWLRDHSTLSLKEAKERVESCGEWCEDCAEYHTTGDTVMVTGLSRTELEAAKKELEEFVGFTNYTVTTE